MGCLDGGVLDVLENPARSAAASVVDRGQTTVGRGSDTLTVVYRNLKRR